MVTLAGFRVTSLAEDRMTRLRALIEALEAYLFREDVWTWPIPGLMT
jgi:hypothetical protein